MSSSGYPARATGERGPAPAGTRLSLLPSFCLSAAGDDIDLPVTAQRLVALLAVFSRPVARAVVAGTLWPDVTERRAHACLRSALWRVRRPGVESIEATATHLRLAAGMDIDLPQLVTTAERLDANLPVDHLASLAARFQDDLLPDWYDDWLIVWRERWRQQRLHALEALARRLARGGRFGAAVDAALAAVRVEPLRESAHRTLIEVHCAEGNHGEAMRQYEVFRKLLDDELHLAPSERMTSLVTAMTRR